MFGKKHFVHDLFYTVRDEPRPWFGWFAVAIVVWSLLFVGGCVSTPSMTAKSRAHVVGTATVVERTTTTTTTADGAVITTTTVVESQKSAPAVDLELKKDELKGRTEVGVAQTKRPVYPVYDGRWYGAGQYGDVYYDRAPPVGPFIVRWETGFQCRLAQNRNNPNC